MLTKGRYHARASRLDDMAAILALRARCFGSAAAERDQFDTAYTHIVVFDTVRDQLVCCFRMYDMRASEITKSYSGQFYDLTALQTYKGPMVEMGRFCVDPDLTDPDILRIAWGAMTVYIDVYKVRMLFGCSSFEGTKPTPFLDAFSMLKARHLAPTHWQPKVKSDDIFAFAADLDGKPDTKNALRTMPPLLRTYLAMGGWVSDHAVIDRQMNTMHVFTGLEIDAIPPARKRLLRALAG